jgi:signal transduction histidine kinase
VNILRNDAQNAMKPRARVRLQAMTAPGGRHVAVTIEDDGPGVPEEHRGDVFHQGSALRPGGSGQGLALVREVVEIEMKGEVRCEEGDLGGARFVLVLPTPAKVEAT